MKIKDLTDAELVEAVAREVLGLSQTNGSYWYLSDTTISRMRIWNPLTDLNDLFMVLDGSDSYMILKNGETGRYTVTVMVERKNAVTTANTLHRAVLEVRLMAERIER